MRYEETEYSYRKVFHGSPNMAPQRLEPPTRECDGEQAASWKKLTARTEKFAYAERFFFTESYGALDSWN